MKKNVLIFSGAPYPAMGILDCLKYSLRYNPIAASSYSNHSEFVFKKTIDGLPFIDDESFLKEFIYIVKENNIEFIIPTDDTIAMILTKNQDTIPAKIICSSYDTALLCRYKSKTYKALNGEYYLPKLYSKDHIESLQEYPVFVKPDNGQGSRGAMKIDSIEAFDRIENIDEMVICEYLPGEEYTVDCFTDRYGKLIFCSPRCRSRLMNGITARGYNVPCDEEFSQIIDRINKKIKFRGYWFAQLKRDKEGSLKLMELCCRFAGTFGVSKSLGANLPLMALCDADDLDTSVIVNDFLVTSDKSYIDRYKIDFSYNTVYVDYDDTITYDNGKHINPSVMSFLYQCVNLGKRLILLSRHTADHENTLSEDMKSHSVSESLFEEIHDLSWDDEKSNYINKKDAIFLDNSFAERKKIHDNCGIPVFDVANIDCLYDWRY